MAKQKNIHKFIPPEGYIFHAGRGLYYNKVRVHDEEGNKFIVMTWFNPDEGTYEQATWPVNPTTGEPEANKYQVPKDKSPFMTMMCSYPTATTKTFTLIAAGVTLVLAFILL